MGSKAGLAYIIKEEGVVNGVRRLARQLDVFSLENDFLRLSRQFGISFLEDYILYRRWGFDEDGEEFDMRIVDVDPAEVTYTHFFPFDVTGENAIIGEGGGPWYRCVKRFDRTRLFQSMHAHFVEGKDWEETEKFQFEVQRVDRGKRTWNGCTTREEIRERCELIDKLYSGMKDDGYLSQEEISTLSPGEKRYYGYQEVNGVMVPDELRVAVGPDGHFIRIEGGRHRLAIAKLLDVEEIPVVVQIVHENLPERTRDDTLARTRVLLTGDRT